MESKILNWLEEIKTGVQTKSGDLKAKVASGKPVEVALMNIEFSWEGSDQTNSSLPVTQDLSGWTSDRKSFAAYSKKDIEETVKAGQLQIIARFAKNIPGGRIQVRTTNAEDFVSELGNLRDNASVFVTENAERVDELLSGNTRQTFPGKNALGNVKPTTVYFDSFGDSVYQGSKKYVPLLLDDLQFMKWGVGIYDIDWKWEFRMLDTDASTEDEDVWQEQWRPVIAEKPFPFSRHRVFVILDTPWFPWTPYRIPDFDRVPYSVPASSDALTLACAWAAGSTTKDEAAARIAEGLNRCGKFVYTPNTSYFREVEKIPGAEYGISTGGAKPVKVKEFFFGKIMERLKGGLGLGEKVNCLDCALTVWTLANLIGCDLKVGKLQFSEDTQPGSPDFIEKNRFEINRICAMGHPDSNKTMAGLKMGDKHYFSFHAIAWQAQWDNMEYNFNHPNNLIYDASLSFVTQQNDKGEDAELKSPSGMKMGTGEEEGSYLNSLAMNSEMGRPRCIPQQVTVVHAQLRYGACGLKE